MRSYEQSHERRPQKAWPNIIVDLRVLWPGLLGWFGDFIDVNVSVSTAQSGCRAKPGNRKLDPMAPGIYFASPGIGKLRSSLSTNNIYTSFLISSPEIKSGVKSDSKAQTKHFHI